METEQTRELAGAACRGDKDAFIRLIGGHKHQLYRMAYSYLGNEADALEALQEVTCRAYRKIGSLREPAYFSTWLFRILINYCQDQLKKRKRQQPLANCDDSAYHQQMEISLSGSEEDRHVQRMMMEEAVGQLAEPYQSIIQLKYYHDWTITEIARTWDKPEGTIKTWLNKALKGLRSKLGEEEDGDE